MSSISVHKREKSWEYRIYLGKENGKTIRITKAGFRTKKEAKEAAENVAFERLQNAMTTMKAKPMTFGEYLDFWIDNYCRINLKETSTRGYTKRIGSVIKPRIGSVLMGNLSPMVLQCFINDVFNAGYSRNELSCIKGVLTSSLRYAVSPAGILNSNPASAIKLPHSRAKSKIPSRKKVREPITVDQWNKLMERFPREHPSHIPLNLGYKLGLRLGEAFGLCWEDVDFDKGTLSINRQVQYSDERKCWYFTEPKYESFRTITMDKQLLELLKDEYQRQERARAYFEKRYCRIYIDAENCFAKSGKEVNLVCIRENGTYIQPRTFQHTNHVVHTELGIPKFDFHTLRHTHATMLIEAGASLLDVKERLGHSKLEITERYTHNTDIMRARTTSILNTIYSVD